MTRLSESDYDVVRVGSRFHIRRPNGTMLRALGDSLGHSRLVTFKTAEEAVTYIRERLVDKAGE